MDLVQAVSWNNNCLLSTCPIRAKCREMPIKIQSILLQKQENVICMKEVKLSLLLQPDMCWWSLLEIMPSILLSLIDASNFRSFFLLMYLVHLNHCNKTHLQHIAWGYCIYHGWTFSSSRAARYQKKKCGHFIWHFVVQRCVTNLLKPLKFQSS